MSIELEFIDYGHPEILDGHVEIKIRTDREWKLFQQLIQRGANLWPDAAPIIKEFADIVTIGHVQQDYHAQDTSKNKLAN